VINHCVLTCSAQVKLFVTGLFSLNQDIPAFKEHLRDFLVQIKVHILFAVAEILRVNTDCILASRIDHFL